MSSAANQGEQRRKSALEKSVRKVLSKSKNYLQKAPTVVFKHLEGREFHLPVVSILTALGFAGLRTAHFLQKQKRILFLRKHNIQQCTDILTRHIEKNNLLYKVLLPPEISDVVSQLPSNVRFYLDSKYTNIPFACIKVVGFQGMEMFLSAKDLISVVHRLFVCFDEEIAKSDICHRFKTINHSFMFSTGCPGQAGALPSQPGSREGLGEVGEGEAESNTAAVQGYFYYAVAMCMELIAKVRNTDFGERGFRISKLKVSCGLDMAETCYSCVIGKKQQWDVFSENMASHLCARNDIPHSVLMKSNVLDDNDASQFLQLSGEDFDIEIPGQGVVSCVLLDESVEQVINIGRKRYGKDVIIAEEIVNKRILHLKENQKQLRRLTSNLKDLKKERQKKRLEKERLLEKKERKKKKKKKKRKKKKKKKKKEKTPKKKKRSLRSLLSTSSGGKKKNNKKKEEEQQLLLEEEEDEESDEGEEEEEEGEDGFSFSSEGEGESDEEEEGETETESESEENPEENPIVEEEQQNPDLKHINDRNIVENDEVTAQNLVSDSDSDEAEANAAFNNGHHSEEEDGEDDDEESGYGIIEREKALRKELKEKAKEERRLKEQEEREKERTRDDVIEKLITKDEVKDLLTLGDYVDPPKGKIRQETTVRGQEIESRLDDRWDYQVDGVAKLLQRDHLKETELTFFRPRMKFTSPWMCCFQCFPKCPWLFCWCLSMHKKWDKSYVNLNRLTFKNMFKKYYKQTRLTIILYVLGYMISIYVDLVKQGFGDEERRDFGYFFKDYSVWDVIFYKYFALVPPLIISNFLCLTSLYIVSFYINMGLTLISLLGTSGVFLANFYLFETYQSGISMYCLVFFHMTIEGLPAIVRSGVLGLVCVAWLVLACVQHSQAHRQDDWEGPQPSIAYLLIQIFAVFFAWIFFSMHAFYRQLRHFEEYFIQGLAEKKKETLSGVKDKSSDLLASLLSEGYLPRLHELSDVSSVSKFYEDVAVMCCKLCNMKEYLELMNHDPTAIVEDLNHIYSQFDTLTDDPRLWRVKSIQGAYIVAAGVPNVSRIASQQIALCAIAMLKWLESNKKHAEFRIGIHTGPVFSGLVMRNRFQLDIFGKTIDISLEFEEKSKAMMIHVSYEFTRAYCHHGNQKKYKFVKRREFVEISAMFIETYWLMGRDGLGDQKKV